MKNGVLRSICRVVLIAFAASLLFSSIAVADNQDIEGKVNINNATVKELAKLPGIGKKKAESIIAYRSENGGFSSIDDLKKVDGIGKKTFEKIKGFLTVEGG